MSRVKLAVIGCGTMTDNHKEAFEKIRNTVKVEATVDIIPEKAQSAAEFLGAPYWAADYHQILKYVDAVLLVLPHHLHYKIGMDCLKHGKHVLMEKPLCNKEQECLDLIHFAEKKGLVLMTAYCMRYHPMVAKLKEIIDEKTYGDVFQVSIWTEQYTRYNKEQKPWICKAETLGGGQLFSHGCHYIDLLLWFLGSPVCGAHMGTNYGTPWMEKEGTSNVTMEFENGALGYHFGTWGAMGSRLKYSIHAHFTKAMIEVAIEQGKMFLHRSGKEPEILLEYPMGKHTHFEIDHFADCVLNNKKPKTNGPDSLQGLRVIWRLYEAEERRVVADLRGLGFFDKWDRLELGKLPE